MKKNFSSLPSPFSLRKGFTLIELLVVISIIAIMIGFLMANFVGARQRGRDAQRKSDLRQIQSAIEIYRSDNGSYPLTASFPACGAKFSGSGGSTYMQKIPCDPSSGATYNYASTDGVTYSMYACLENANDSDKDTSAQSGCTTSFTVQNP